MSFLGKCLAPIYTGLAFSRFAHEKYEDAARFLEKAIQLDPKTGRMEFIYSCLGRSYLALGRENDALETLATTYEIFHDKGLTFKGTSELRQYYEFLKAYSSVLHKVGQIERATEIAHEAKEIESKLH